MNEKPAVSLRRDHKVWPGLREEAGGADARHRAGAAWAAWVPEGGGAPTRSTTVASASWLSSLAAPYEFHHAAGLHSGAEE